MSNLRNDPHLSISVQDRDDPQSYLLVHGRVEEITSEGADANIDRLAKRFLDEDTYPYRMPDEQRLLVRIEAGRTSGMRPWAPIG